jgi:thioredoxin
MSDIHVLDRGTFEHFAMHAAPTVIVDFWAPWCSPCIRFQPVMERIAGEWEPEVAFGKVNVDHEPELARRFRVSGIPTLLMFKQGKLHDTRVGALSGSELTHWINEAQGR